jgi:hypothetical protein
MKDFYDLWVLSRQFSFDGETLARAIRATFDRRQTAIAQTLPIALTAEFGEHPDKIKQWRAFLNRNRLETDGQELPEVLTQLRTFLLAPWQALAAGQPFKATWTPKGP